jgi:hypothetical protein
VANILAGRAYGARLPEVPRRINGRWALLSGDQLPAPPAAEARSCVRLVGGRYLEAVGVGPGRRGWAALTECGRVVTVVNQWERVPPLQTRWQVISATHEELLEREPICEMCRFRGFCRLAVEGQRAA